MSEPKLVIHADKERAEYTKQFSTLVRTLGVTAFASAWLLAGALGSNADSPLDTLHLLAESDYLAWTAGAAVIALTLDALQYLVGSILWSMWAWSAKVLADPSTPPGHSQYRIAFRIGCMTGLVAALEPSADSSKPTAERARNLSNRVATSDPIVVAPLAIEGATGIIKTPITALFFAKAAALIVAFYNLTRFVLST